MDEAVVGEGVLGFEAGERSDGGSGECLKSKHT